MIIEHFNYREFKSEFYKRFPDPQLFQVGEVNYIKVIMDCLVVRYALKGKIRPYIFYRFYGIFLILKRLLLAFKRKGDFNALKKYSTGNFSREYILVDNGRKVKDKNGNYISMYFELIVNYFKDNDIDYLHYFEGSNEENKENELRDGRFHDLIKVLPLNSRERKIVKDLQTLFSHLKSKGLFSDEELSHIASGLVVFFEKYRLWNYHIKVIKPRRVFILGHYHREGLILACRQNNVEVFELQHGLIAREDVFYVLPEFFKNISASALFSDRIFTYGDNWTKVLSEGFEFNNDQIQKLGYYLYEDENGSIQEEEELFEFSQNKRGILITTQPALRIDFIRYIKSWIDFLGDNSSKYAFIVKLHPADKVEWYQELSNFPNILVTRTRLDVLFKYCEVHVTSYSTTLFDALKYRKVNYSVNFPASSDYVDGVVQKGISILIQPNEFPDLNSIVSQSTGAEYYFEKPNFQLLLN
jgi:hypothetical protein